MTIINQIDCGAPSHPWLKPVAGQITTTVIVEGTEEITWSRGSVTRKQTVRFQVRGWQALGGAAAGSQTATKYLLKQLEELASNRDQQPCFIQWTATADPAASLNASDLHDGWYLIENFEPDYQDFVVSGIVTCRMTVALVAPAPPRRVSLAYAGGALASNFSGAATNLLSFPKNVGGYGFGRTGGEGTIGCSLSPVPGPFPFQPPNTLSDLFKGGVHVYDTINTGSNPVPTTGGTFVHANWVEVFGTDHDFVGDCAITNGLLLLLFVVAASPALYLWNTALATANWQQALSVSYIDSAGNVGGQARAYSLVRVGPEECALAELVDSGNSPFRNQALFSFRLQRGRFECRLDYRSQGDAGSSVAGPILFAQGSSNPKILYNSAHITDQASPPGEGSPAIVTDYGYGAGFKPDSLVPFIFGILYQNQPTVVQPQGYGAGNGDMSTGDSGVAINAQRSYGFFAIPFGTSGTLSPLHLQAEAESGTLDAGWTSQANAAASGGNEAKCASGTVTGRACNDLYTKVIPAGTYNVWARVKVTSAASSTAQMQFGLFNNTTSAWAPVGIIKAPNQVTTAYAWYLIGSVTANGTDTYQIPGGAKTTATTDTDWFIDEFALTPKTLTADNRGPQDIYQQFMFDRSVRLVRQ